MGGVPVALPLPFAPININSPRLQLLPRQPQILSQQALHAAVVARVPAHQPLAHKTMTMVTLPHKVDVAVADDPIQVPRLDEVLHDAHSQRPLPHVLKEEERLRFPIVSSKSRQEIIHLHRRLYVRDRGDDTPLAAIQPSLRRRRRIVEVAPRFDRRVVETFERFDKLSRRYPIHKMRYYNQDDAKFANLSDMTKQF